jgi:putative transposase
VNWYNHQHRHRGIRFVTPDQRHSGLANAICRQRPRVYKHARQRHPRFWSRSARSWGQPEVVWINPPPPENAINPATLAMAA